MTERERKLAFIAGLTEWEWYGWMDALRLGPRKPFDGEVAALIARAKELNITI